MGQVPASPRVARGRVDLRDAHPAQAPDGARHGEGVRFGGAALKAVLVLVVACSDGRRGVVGVPRAPRPPASPSPSLPRTEHIVVRLAAVADEAERGGRLRGRRGSSRSVSVSDSALAALGARPRRRLPPSLPPSLTVVPAPLTSPVTMSTLYSPAPSASPGAAGAARAPPRASAGCARPARVAESSRR